MKKNKTNKNNVPAIRVTRLSHPYSLLQTAEAAKVPAPPAPKKHYFKTILRVLALIIVVVIGIRVININIAPGVPSAATKAPVFNKRLYSINDPSSLWAIANKGRILPSSYVPSDLVVPHVPLRLAATDPEMEVRKPMAQALEQMVGAANDQGIHLMLASGYRSYDEQIGLYNGYVATQGKGYADSSSARPGHSEHQLGLSADIEPSSRNCEVDPCFAQTPEGQWLAANSYKYGLIIRYPKGAESITGYEYEPWHVRYVGTALAAQIHKTGQTMEQFFDLPYYNDYPAQPYELAIGR